MRIKEILTEGRDAPLYHYTSPKGFEQILLTDTLKGRPMMNRSNGQINKQPTISFTRDYNRDFVPGSAASQSLGFRVDQSKLAQLYKMQAAAQRQIPNLEKFERELSPHYQQEIAKMRQTGNYSSGMSIGGVSLADLAKRTAAQQNRWESEERVVASAISNFSKYITGIVIPGKYVKNKDLITFLTTQDRKPGAVDMYKFRNMVLDSAIKLGVPIIWQRREYDPRAVKQQIIDMYKERKAKSANPELQQELAEAFDSTVQSQITAQTPQQFQTVAKIGDRVIIFNAVKEEHESWGVSFIEKSKKARDITDWIPPKSDRETYKVTGSGNQMQVFSFVIQSIQKFLSLYHPNRMVFTALKEGNRAVLYGKLLSRVKLSGYKLNAEATRENNDKKIFVIDKVNDRA